MYFSVETVFLIIQMYRARCGGKVIPLSWPMTILKHALRSWALGAFIFGKIKTSENADNENIRT